MQDMYDPTALHYEDERLAPDGGESVAVFKAPATRFTRVNPRCAFVLTYKGQAYTAGRRILKLTDLTKEDNTTVAQANPLPNGFFVSSGMYDLTDAGLAVLRGGRAIGLHEVPMRVWVRDQIDFEYDQENDPFRFWRWPVKPGPGVYVLLSGASGGKTTLVKSLNANVYATGEREAHTSFSPEAMSWAISSALADGTAPAVIDSGRFLSISGDSLGAGGIPREMYEIISEIEFACKAMNRIVIICLNVMTMVGSNAFLNTLEAVGGSCTGIIEIVKSENRNDSSGLSVTVKYSVAPKWRSRQNATLTLNAEY